MNYLNFKKQLTITGVALLMRRSLITFIFINLIYIPSIKAEIEDNAAYKTAYTAWAGTHFILLPTSFLPGPLGMAADISTIGIDIRIKTLPAKLIAPTPDAVTPNSDDGCEYSFMLPQVEASYENLLGFADIKTLPNGWGAFSNVQAPVVEHANAEVVLRVNHVNLDEWQPNDRTVAFPSGRHPIVWSANTQIDPLLDVAIPFALFVITNEIKYFKSFFEVQTDPATAKRAAEVGSLFLLNAGIETGLFSVSQIESNIPIDSAVHSQTRPFQVLDINPPSISTSNPNPSPLEANSLGGEPWSLHKDDFKATITATDPCNMPLLVGNDAPFLLPLGDTTVTWEAIDTGPLGVGNNGVATVTQTIRVEDTRPPIILAPPSRVIVSSSAATTDDFDIGTAVVFDVADPNPLVINSVGSSFLPDTRTEVFWTATDSSGNSSSKTQWITVKTPGTNTQPSVVNVSASGLTSQLIDITLTGSDTDLLSGTFDPLMFDISTPPADGFFVSPLVPYFIEDFRVKPGDLVGDILSTSALPSTDLYNAFCAASPSVPIPTDFVYNSQFVHVTDDDISFVLDKYWQCDPSNAVTYNRLSKWSANGDLMGQIDVNSMVKRITLDRDGFLYAVTPEFSSDELFLNKYDDQFNSVQSWKLDTIPVSLGHDWLLGATMDSQTGLIFATDKKRVYVFDGADGQFKPAFLGTLKNAEYFLSAVSSVAGSSSRGFYSVVDSIGSFYIVDSGSDRIHKFKASQYDGVTFSPGDYIGWMGRCDSGPGCNQAKGRSYGYSCNDNTPCDVVIANGSNCGIQTANPCTSGDKDGQFDTPLGIALDPNDILYVTDYQNSRVQRFTPLGDFAGVAASTCDGTCFILGDMGMPLDISVNSTKFHVLDDQRNLMHVFETAPFKEITDNSVVLTYASDNDFQGTDTFSYVVNDGLIESNQGTATVTISRNFRAPETINYNLLVSEDQMISFNLIGSDPDGIIGVDFNGLDTLSYEIIQQPQHGILSGVGVSRTYMPDENYNGTDSFTYRVNDGLFDSNISTVTFVLQPVNDIPVVQFTNGSSQILPKTLWPLLKGKIAGLNVQAGLGYPLPLMAEFFDPDIGQSHFLQISWGDGIIDQTDQNPPADPNNPPDEPVITNTFNNLGQIMGKHTYFSTGIQTIGITVIDADGGTSVTAMADIDVIPMIDVSLGEIKTPINDFSQPGELTTMNIIVTNKPPESPIVGMSATGVEFTGTMPAGFQFISIVTSQGTCSHFDLTSTCQIGILAPDDSAVITVKMLPTVNFDPTTAGYVIDATSIEPDASIDNLTVLEIPVKSQVIFADGFD